MATEHIWLLWLQVIHSRFGPVPHIIVMIFAFVTNIIVAGLVMAEGTRVLTWLCQGMYLSTSHVLYYSASVYVCLSVCLYGNMYLCLFLCMSLSVYVYLSVHMSVCVSLYVTGSAPRCPDNS